MINQLTSLLQQRAQKIHSTMQQHSHSEHRHKLHGAHIALHDCMHYLAQQSTSTKNSQQSYHQILNHLQKQFNQINKAKQNINNESNKKIAQSILQELLTIQKITKHLASQKIHSKLNTITNQKESEIRKELTQKLK